MVVKEKINSLQTLIALDVGERRIGVAIASLASRLPRPLTTLINQPGIVDQIAALVSQENAIGLVIGLPRNLGGENTAQTAYVRHFVESFNGVIHVPLHWCDEALTSVAAEEELKARRVSYNKADIDSLAACYILSDFMASYQKEL